MSSYERCQKCGRWGFTASHVCPPTFLVWCPEYDQEEDEATRMGAADAREAAERWAEERDRRHADYDIVGGRVEPVVHVRDADGALTRWVVTGESVPQYSAIQAAEPEPPADDAASGSQP